MSELGKFIAFQAAINLLKDRGADVRIKDVYHACLEEVKKPKEEKKQPTASGLEIKPPVIDIKQEG